MYKLYCTLVTLLHTQHKVSILLSHKVISFSHTWIFLPFSVKLALFSGWLLNSYKCTFMVTLGLLVKVIIILICLELDTSDEQDKLMPRILLVSHQTWFYFKYFYQILADNEFPQNPNS